MVALSITTRRSVLTAKVKCGKELIISCIFSELKSSHCSFTISNEEPSFFILSSKLFIIPDPMHAEAYLENNNL
jgi:hypothetical protein